MIMIEIQYSGTAIIIIAGEPMLHTALKQWHHASSSSEKKMLCCQLYIQPIMQQYKSTTV